jgi:hypothetical protein
VKNRRNKIKREHKANASSERKAKPKRRMSNTTVFVLCVVVPLLLGGFTNFFAHKCWILYFPLAGILIGLGYAGHLAIRTYSCLDKNESPALSPTPPSATPTSSAPMPDNKPTHSLKTTNQSGGQNIIAGRDVHMGPKAVASVTVQGVKLEEPLVAGRAPLLVVRIQNTGPSPALGLHMVTKTLLAQKIDDAKWTTSMTQAADDGIILPPGVPDDVHYKAKWIINQEHIDDIKNDRVFLFIIGFIDYTDAAKETHRTQFSFQTAGKYLEDGLLRQSDTGNKAY